MRRRRWRVWLRRKALDLALGGKTPKGSVRAVGVVYITESLRADLAAQGVLGEFLKHEFGEQAKKLGDTWVPKIS